MKITKMSLHHENLEMWREIREQYRSYTAEGVVYHEELAGPNGMSFLLLPGPGHTREDVERAARKLYRDRDVVRMQVMWLDGEPKE